MGLTCLFKEGSYSLHRFLLVEFCVGYSRDHTLRSSQIKRLLYSKFKIPNDTLISSYGWIY